MEDELEIVKNVGDSLYKESNFKAVEEEYDRLIAKYIQEDNNTGVAIAYNNRGHAKYMQVNFIGAKEDYNTSLKLNPKLAIGYYNRATVVFRMGCYLEALPDFQMALRLDQTKSDFQEGLKHCQQMLE